MEYHIFLVLMLLVIVMNVQVKVHALNVLMIIKFYIMTIHLNVEENLI